MVSQVVCWNVHSALLPTSRIYGELSVNTVEIQQCIKTKHVFFFFREPTFWWEDTHPWDEINHASSQSFACASGLGPKWFLTRAGGVDPRSLREGLQLNCRSAFPLWAADVLFHLCIFTCKHMPPYNNFYLTRYPSLTPASYPWLQKFEAPQNMRDCHLKKPCPPCPTLDD